MSTNADEIIDRRRLRKKISFWRILTFLTIAVALLTAVGFGAREAGLTSTTRDHIAQVEISGVITNDKAMLKLLKDLGENDRVKGVLLNVSSPGGSTVGGEAMYEAIRELSEKKPVTASIGTLAASAGYMISAATDHIVARRSSIVGSIGVLFQYADASELLDKVGVKINSVKSGDLKAQPSPFNPASPEAVAMIDNLIQDSYSWFVSIVAERRSMTIADTRKLADGSIFTGNQGKENGLVDTIGGEDEALKWLREEKELGSDIEPVTYKPARPGQGLLVNPAGLQRIAKIIGIDLTAGEATAIEKALRERLLLDGLVSIWQGSAGH